MVQQTESQAAFADLRIAWIAEEVSIELMKTAAFQQTTSGLDDLHGNVVRPGSGP